MSKTNSNGKREYRKQPARMDMDALARFVSARADKLGLISADVARRTHPTDESQRLDPSTTWRIMKGHYPSVRPATMTLLARALEVSEDTLWSVALGETAPEFAYEEITIALPAGVREELARDAARCHRRSIEDHITALLSAYVVENVNVSARKMTLLKSA